MRNRAILKRLGYLREVFDLDSANLRDRLQRKLSAGYVVFDPLSPRQEIRNARWRLLINVDAETLTRWREM
jgi:predicted transcriptional regulator of viral defense system